MEEDDRIAVSKETVRQIMIKQELWTPKARKQPQYFSLRERKDNYGEMEQFDYCYHRWFYGLNEEQCLLDATGKTTKAKFGLNEGVIPVFTFWKEYILEHGKPLSIYLDKFSTYKVNHKYAEDNKDLMTQFQRATKEMGTRIINANAPQAKGRVERMNQTFQNRLVKELRLRGIKTIPETNEFLEKEFLPRFNVKFAVVPKSKTDLHKKIGKDVNLDEIFSIQKQRVIGNNYVVRYENNYYQLNEIQPTTVYKKSMVIVETKIDGQVLIKQGKHYLSFVVLPARPKREIDVVLPALTQRKSDWIPPVNHPWKAASFRRRQAIINARV